MATSESRLVITIDSRSAEQRANDTARALSELEKHGLGAQAGVSEVNRALKSTEGAAGAAAASVRRLITGALAGLSAMKIVEMADSWGQYASRIRMATKDAGEYETVQRRMAQSARDTYRSIEETREGFIRMSPTLRSMGLSLDQSIDAIDTFSGLLVVNAASADRGASAMDALSKSLQRGKIDQDAWSSIASTMPSIIDLIGKTTNRTAEEVRKLGVDGKISVEDMSRTLVEMADVVRKQVADMPTTVADALGNLRNSFTEYIGWANEGYGATAGLAAGIDVLGENFEAIASVVGGSAVAGLSLYTLGLGKAAVESVNSARAASLAASEKVVAAVAAEASASASLREAQATHASTAADLAKIAGLRGITETRAQAIAVEAAHARSTQALAAADAQATAARTALNAATAANVTMAGRLLALVGGPVGLAMTGLSVAVGAGAMAFANASREAAELDRVLQGLSKPLDEVIARFRTLNADARAGELVNAERAHEKAIRDAADAYSELETRAQRAMIRAGATAEQIAEFSAKLDEARTRGDSLLPVLEELQRNFQPPKAAVQEIVALNSAYASANSTLQSSAAGFVALSNEMSRVGHQAVQAAASVTTLNAALVKTDEAGKKYLENLTDRSLIAGLTTQRAQLDALVKAGKLVFSEEDLERARKHAAAIDASAAASRRSSAPARSLGDEQKRLAEQMQAVVDRALPQRKALADLQTSTKQLEEARKRNIITDREYVEGLMRISQEHTTQARDAIPESLQAAQQAAEAGEQQLLQLRQQIAQFGLSRESVIQLAMAETDASIAKLQSARATEVANEAEASRIDLIDQEIRALQKLRETQSGSAQAAAEIDRMEAAQRFADEQVRYNEQIGQSLTDALLRGFESGEGFGKNFINTLKNLFNTLVLRPIIQPIAQGAASAVTSALGLGGQAGGAGGINLSSVSGLFTNFGGSLGDSLGNLGMRMSGMTGKMGELGASLAKNSAEIGKIAGQAGNVLSYGKAIYDLTQGNWGSGVGTAVGQYFGGPIGAAIGSTIGSFIDSKFAGETRSGAQYGLAVNDALYNPRRGTTVASANGVQFLEGPSGGGASSAVQQAIQATTDGINGLFETVGADISLAAFWAGFEGSEKGRGGVGAGGMLSSGAAFGETGQGDNYAGTLFDRMRATTLSAEEALNLLPAQLAQASLQAWQSASDQMPGMFGRMLQGKDFAALDDGKLVELHDAFVAAVVAAEELRIGLSFLPFAPAAAQTFRFASALIDYVGSAEEATSLLANAYQNYWSEAERVGHVTERVTEGFATLGLEVPKTRAEMQALLTANMALGEGGAKTTAALLNLGDGLDIVLTASEAAAEALKQVDDAREQERLGLEGRILQLEGDTVELRRRELAALDPANRALKEFIWNMEAAAEAASIAADAQKATHDEIDSLAASYNDTIDPAGKAARSQRSLLDGFEALGLQMPTTRASFHDMVEAARLAGPEFDETYLALLRLTPAFADYVTGLDDMAEATKASAKAFADAQQSARDSIAQSIGGLQERIILDQLGSDSARHGYYDAQFQTYAGLAGSLNDPAAIADAVSKAMAAASNAYGLLDEAGRAANNDAYLKTLSQLQERSNESVERANKDAAEQQGKVLVGLLKPVMDETIRAIRQAVTNSDDGSRNVTRAIETLEDNLIEAVSRSGRHALEVTG